MGTVRRANSVVFFKNGRHRAPLEDRNMRIRETKHTSHAKCAPRQKEPHPSQGVTQSIAVRLISWRHVDLGAEPRWLSACLQHQGFARVLRHWQLTCSRQQKAQAMRLQPKLTGWLPEQSATSRKLHRQLRSSLSRPPSGV